MPLAASWFTTDWSPEGSDVYPGGVVLRDDAGNALRVTLGPGDVDCRPGYAASPDDWIVKAVVAVEDGTFWTHHGVRPLSILRAAAQNVFYRRRISGASTISMQTVRLIRPHPKTLWWKWKEAILAFKMERQRDKLWILSQYLNRTPYGSNLVGIEAAAQGWFGKGAKDLGLGEAALLAGMVQAPSRFRPDRGYERALRRRDYVLDRMVTLGTITPEQSAAARTVFPVVRRAPRPFKAPHFCDWALRRLSDGRDAPRTSGDVATTLNADIQRLAENAVGQAAAKGGYSVAAVVVHARTGAVKALACSGDYFGAAGGQVNVAAAPRPAGSTLKPFLVALAFDRGLATPEERVADVPQAYRGYRPANFDATHRGAVTVRDALVLSLNVPFVQMLRKVGVTEFGATLRELGFAHLGGSDASFGLGMAIGNVEVSLVELVSAYATLARGGVARPLAALQSELVGRDGGGDAALCRVFSAGSAYLVSDILSGDERASAAFGHVAAVPVSRFAWKTGTSSAYRDAWTVAWNPDYVIGVWCGHQVGGFGDKTLVGAKAAAPVALALARSLYPQNDGPWFAKPPEVREREVCPVSGLPRGANCPPGERGRFLAGRSDGRPCGVHVRNAQGNVVERTDAALAAFSGRADAAERLQIAKPEDGASFVRVKGMPQQKVVCQALGNPAGARLWWLLDGVVVGESVGAEALALEMTAGDHALTCVSADGVSASVRYTVTEE